MWRSTACVRRLSTQHDFWIKVSTTQWTWPGVLCVLCVPCVLSVLCVLCVGIYASYASHARSSVTKLYFSQACCLLRLLQSLFLRSMLFVNFEILQSLFFVLPYSTFSEGPQLRKMNPPRIERIERIELSHEFLCTTTVLSLCKHLQQELKDSWSSDKNHSAIFSVLVRLRKIKPPRIEHIERIERIETLALMSQSRSRSRSRSQTNYFSNVSQRKTFGNVPSWGLPTAKNKSTMHKLLITCPHKLGHNTVTVTNSASVNIHLYSAYQSHRTLNTLKSTHDLLVINLQFIRMTSYVMVHVLES